MTTFDKPHMMGNNRYVKSEWVELALNSTAEGLEQTISAAGTARYAEHEAKKVKATLMISPDNPEKAVAMKEAWATAHPEYDAAYKYFCEAHGAELLGKDKSRKAEAIISAWQTEERQMSRGNL